MLMRQPDVDITPDLIIGAALLTPSFQADLSTWRLSIAKDGSLVQELNPAFSCRHIYESVTVRLETKLDRQDVSTLLSLVTDVGFFDLLNEYSEGPTDCEKKSITVQSNERVKRVIVYAAEYHVHHEGKEEIEGYIRLWETLTSLMPFRKTTAIALSEDEAKRRLRMHI